MVSPFARTPAEAAGDRISGRGAPKPGHVNAGCAVARTRVGGPGASRTEAGKVGRARRTEMRPVSRFETERH